MTDRYYPKGYVPDCGPLESTYNEMNVLNTHPKSNYPPGYSGHEHGSGFKFGYSIPAPNALPQEPINPEDPLVNYRIGKHIIYRPLPNREIQLENAPKEQKRVEATIRGVEDQKASIKVEDDFTASFIPQTSAYLASINGNRGHTVEKAQPYIPAEPGRGTGFNSQSTYVSWLPPGSMHGCSTQTKDSYTVPNVVRRGLEMMQYTVNREAGTQ